VFARGESSSTFGRPGTLKSALKTEVAICIASGRDWRGYRTVEKAGVVYFAFERRDQVLRRFAAYEVRDGVKKLPIAVCGKIIDLVDGGCVDTIIDTVRSAEVQFGISVGFIIFDTWSKGISAGGHDEDKATVQNIVAANLLERLPGIHISGVGHTGKNEERGERGSNARQGDVDLQIQIKGAGAVKTATVIKANDQPEGDLASFEIESVKLGVDEDGDDITAGILSTRVISPKAAKRLTDRQRLALDALRKAIEAHGQPLPLHTTNISVLAVALEKWKDELFRNGTLDRDAPNPRVPFKRLRDSLGADGHIVEDNGLVWLADAKPIPNVPGK